MSNPLTETFFSSRCVLGTAGLGGIWGPVNVEESIQTILHALDSGCTAIDMAPAYADAEVIVGEALKLWKGKLPFISTKVGRLKSFASGDGSYDYSNEGMEQSVMNSLQTLGVPCVDLLLLHEPEVVSADEVERVVEKMVSFKRRGIAQKIGLGGNYPDCYKSYLSKGVFDVVMRFNKLNACIMEDQYTELPFCIDNNIEYFLASPLYMGLLGQRFDEFSLNKPDWIPEHIMSRAREVKLIADKYNMPLNELAHRYLLGLSSAFRIVIGASNMQQLTSTIKDINHGPLPLEIQTQIADCLQDKTMYGTNR
ncbi:aldo/keto reductase [Pinibacter aurantiacus]|uniref:Aldo/keto reductase n=1 Tax=Pinibacter aurantiacus TaxID=2851599 RepID=A0A9E2W439_9BACT|nr:aldo/keto reductase [Pinibacter aurantiacus]MBV4357484.1 aldo/keto reductase [Pinibacter aurantiacus]